MNFGKIRMVFAEDTGDNQGSTGNPEERFGNLQKEMDRKLSNQNTKIEELTKQNSELIKAMNQVYLEIKPDKKVTKQIDEVDDNLLYSDPAAYRQQIETKIEKKIETKLSSEKRREQILNDIVTEYPEISDESSPLAQETFKVFKQLSSEEQGNPLSYKFAVQQAALNQGVRPRSKRVSEDGFTMGNSSLKNDKKASKVSDKTTFFAKMMGVDLNKTENKDALAKWSKRSFKRWATDENEVESD